MSNIFHEINTIMWATRECRESEEAQGWADSYFFDSLFWFFIVLITYIVRKKEAQK